MIPTYSNIKSKSVLDIMIQLLSSLLSLKGVCCFHGMEHTDNKPALHPASTYDMFLIEK